MYESTSLSFLIPFFFRNRRLGCIFIFGFSFASTCFLCFVVFWINSFVLTFAFIGRFRSLISFLHIFFFIFWVYYRLFFSFFLFLSQTLWSWVVIFLIILFPRNMLPITLQIRLFGLRASYSLCMSTRTSAFSSWLWLAFLIDCNFFGFRFSYKSFSILHCLHYCACSLQFGGFRFLWFFLMSLISV